MPLHSFFLSINRLRFMSGAYPVCDIISHNIGTRMTALSDVLGQAQSLLKRCPFQPSPAQPSPSVGLNLAWAGLAT